MKRRTNGQMLVISTPKFPPVNSGGLIEAGRRGSRDQPNGWVSAGEFRRPH